ncbi:gag-pol polyprotein, partial [Trifolium medium]|nr:gag-pol polyprotein [Trifolium medium]
MAEENNNTNNNNKNDDNMTLDNGGPSSQQQNVVIVPTASYAKQFPDVTKIEEFDGQNFKRWQERVY